MLESVATVNHFLNIYGMERSHEGKPTGRLSGYETQGAKRRTSSQAI
jgi:hypothetical protein